MLDEYSDSQLEAELKRRKQAQLAAPAPLPNPDFSALVKFVTGSVEELAKPDGRVKDFKQYVWEEVMTTVYGKDIWSWWKKGPGKRACD